MSCYSNNLIEYYNLALKHDPILQSANYNNLANKQLNNFRTNNFEQSLISFAIGLVKDEDQIK